MANITTEAIMITGLTTMEAEEPLFNFTGIWISIGVLGGFVLLLIIYGLVIAQTGRLHLPQRTDDKEPLSPGRRENDVEADHKKTSPGSKRADPLSSGETENATVADEPPSYDKAVTAASTGQEPVKGVDNGDVTVEVYEQKVDTADEMA